jgi:hypothetical protein
MRQVLSGAAYAACCPPDAILMKVAQTNHRYVPTRQSRELYPLESLPLACVGLGDSPVRASFAIGQVANNPPSAPNR